MTESTKVPRSSSAGLFDLRYILALLFGIYGVVVTIMGIGFTSAPDLAKAGGINVNLWSGIVMLIAAALFALWARLRPVKIPENLVDAEPDVPVESPLDK